MHINYKRPFYNLFQTEITKNSQENGPVMNRQEGQIEWNDKTVLGKGLSFVFLGRFATAIPCAVKRVTSDKGDPSGESEKKVKQEIEIWMNWSKNCKDRLLPIVECYGFERDKNEDFWLLLT